MITFSSMCSLHDGMCCHGDRLALLKKLWRLLKELAVKPRGNSVSLIGVWALLPEKNIFWLFFCVKIWRSSRGRAQHSLGLLLKLTLWATKTSPGWQRQLVSDICWALRYVWGKAHWQIECSNREHCRSYLSEHFSDGLRVSISFSLGWWAESTLHLFFLVTTATVC